MLGCWRERVVGAVRSAREGRRGEGRGGMDGSFTGERSARKRKPGEAFGDAPELGGKQVKTQGGRSLYHCDYCHRDITKQVRVRCSECEDFDLCVDCFAVGVELDGHSKGHKYCIIEVLDFPVLEDTWSCEDELLLLEAIDMYGIGNWQEISEHIVTHDKHDCKAHWYAAYLDGTATLAEGSLRVAALAARGAGGGRGGRHGAPGSVKRESVYVDPGSGGTSLLGTPAGTPKKEGGEAAEREGKGRENEGPFGEGGPTADKPKDDLTGYNPFRGEFEPEYHNDAELDVAKLSFLPTDTDEEVGLKLRVVQAYNNLLDERAFRRQFVLDHGLLNTRKQGALDRRRTKEEREIASRLRVFQRFMSPGDCDRFVDGLCEERRLRAQIARLREWRANGIQTLADGEYYEVEKRKRDAEAALRKAKQGSSYLYTQPTQRHSSSNRANRYASRGEESADLTAALLESSATAGSGGPKGLELQKLRGQRPSGVKDMSRGPTLSQMPGWENLSASEQALCSRLRLVPLQYLQAKEAFILAGREDGGLTPASAQALLRIAPESSIALLQFMAKHRWVTIKAAAK